MSRASQPEISRMETLLRGDQAIVLAGLAAITALAWIYVLTGAGLGMNPFEMTATSLLPHRLGQGAGMDMRAAQEGVLYWTLMLAMWWVMMIAMMTPSAAPMILLYARVQRHNQKQNRLAVGAVPATAFAAGYLAVWLAFSLAAATAQFALERAGIVSAMMMWSISPLFTGGTLVAAGLYQLSPLKDVCLARCRSPADFLSRHWRPGHWGAWRMGIAHGAYCVGCCWVLMALLFVGGVMNLLWIAGLSIFVMLEKTLPDGHAIARLAGGVLLAGGLAVILMDA